MLVLSEVKPADQHQDHNGERRREQHPGQSEQDTRRENTEDRQRRRQVDHPVLEDRHDEIALDLLHRDQHGDGPEPGTDTLPKAEDDGGYGGHEDAR